MYREHVNITVLSNTLDIQKYLEQGLAAHQCRNCHIHTSSNVQDSWDDSDIILCALPIRRLQP